MLGQRRAESSVEVSLLTISRANSNVLTNKNLKGRDKKKTKRDA
jgi:hypothetical protein